MQILARTGHPDFLDLPWTEPLASWRNDRLVEVVRGISRHVVRFVEYEGAIYALKELPAHFARREYGHLRHLGAQGMPVVEAVGVVTDRGEDLQAVLITRHLDYSLPYRALFGTRGISNLRVKLLGSLAELIVRLHLAGFFWGDCSLSNTLFRRDAGALSAYLVDAETGELHPTLTPGQRRHDLMLAEENIAGELLDVQAWRGLPDEIDPFDVAAGVGEAYESLWSELTREETFGPDERHRIDERLRRLNELGFDVEEIELERDGDAYRLRLDPHVVEPGHHRRRLLQLTGLNAQENQARRLLNDLTRFRAAVEEEAKRPLPITVVAYRWLSEVFEPAVAAVPEELWGKREAAEVFHEILEHRWYLSEQEQKDVGILDAATSYVTDVLRHAPDERVVSSAGAEEEEEADEVESPL
jgi:hypothetical protein